MERGSFSASKNTRTFLSGAARAVLTLISCSAPEPVDSSMMASLSSAAPAALATDPAGPVEEAVAGFDVVSEVEQTGETSVEVHTDIVDPRGGNGSAEAGEALEAWEAAATVDGVENLTVNDG